MLLPLRSVLLVCVAMVPARLGVAQARSNYEELQTFSGVLNHIRVNYVDSVHYGDLVRAAIDGVLRSLDPHSRFVAREDVERGAALQRGDLGSVGLVLEDVDGLPTVLTVLDRSPADKKGIAAGDRVVAIDDTTIAGLDAKTVELRLAGKPGSRVTLSLERGPRLEPQSYRVALKRERIVPRSVGMVHLLDRTTGYVWLAEFGSKAPDELEKAINQVRRDGARQLVLDLRGNPGGSVAASVEIASLFLPRNTLVFRTCGRKRDVDEDFVTKRDGKFRDLPLIVLIDRRSASASEALAGSLQDHDRALLVGSRSFGKALMQAPFVLPAGDIVWLTIGRVLTPSGRFIQRRYQDLRAEQYLSFAGRSGAERDTAEVFHTTAGRAVRGGGGIRPDVEVSEPRAIPVWHAVAADSGFDDAVADSVGFDLPPGDQARAEWESDAQRWHADLLAPFLARVRQRLGVTAVPDSALAWRLTRGLAARTIEVRWGADARDAFLLRTDPVTALAVAQFPGLAARLAPPGQ
ncbi:MAG: S41 family peptidase [Gemmatimonadota bacterium]|nr:S41 family peptidase [Gemmatimonadota bacterium]